MSTKSTLRALREFTSHFSFSLSLSIINLSVVIGLGLGNVGCVTKYEFEREVIARGTFGEEVHRALSRDARYSPRAASERGALLERERIRLVTALDTLVTPDRTSQLESLLRALAPLQDTGLLPDLTRKIATLLDAFTDQAAVVSVLEARIRRARYRAPLQGVAFGALLEHLTRFPRLRELIGRVTLFALTHDGVDEVGSDTVDEPRTLTQLTALFAETLREFEPELNADYAPELNADYAPELNADYAPELNAGYAPGRALIVLGTILLKSDPRFLSTRGGGEESIEDQASRLAAPLWATQLDPYGAPHVQRDTSGDLPPPFIDRDEDGFADRDRAGSFVNFAGDPISAPAFATPYSVGEFTHDHIGRALKPANAPIGPDPDDVFVFDYVNLEQSALIFLLEQGAELLELDVIFELIEVAEKLLPPRLNIQEGVEYWERYPVVGNVWLELVYAALELIAFERLDELIELGARTVREREQTLAELLGSFEEFTGELDRDPSATLTEGNTFIDDLLERVQGLFMERESSALLFDDLLRALEAPVIARCSAPLSELLDYSSQRAVPPPGSPYHLCFDDCATRYDLGSVSRLECIRACPRAMILETRLEHNSAESNMLRSHWERTLALFRTTAGLGYEMRVLELDIPSAGVNSEVADLLPPLLRIEDVAAAYIDTIAGRFKLVDHVTEEALESGEVDSLIEGLSGVCGSGIFESLAQALIPSLTRVTESDLERVCERLRRVGERADLSTRERKRQQIAVMVSFLSLLTDVEIGETPTAAQMTRFFNTPNPSIDLNIARLSLSQIVDHDGYFLWEHHGDMLYAVEATGLLDVAGPLFEVFSRHNLASEVVALMATLDRHYPTPNIIHRDRAGLPTPRAGLGSGLSRLEGPLSAWLKSASPCGALNELAVETAPLESARLRPFGMVLGEWIYHALHADLELARRDGVNTHRRADGRVTTLSRVTLLGDALSSLSERADSVASAAEVWSRTSEALYDQFLTIERVNGAARFTNEGALAFVSATLETLELRARRERDAGLIVSAVRDDLYLTLEHALTGRALPLLFDTYTGFVTQSGGRELILSFARYALTSVGRRALTLTIYELLIDAYQAFDLTPLIHALGELSAPDYFRTLTSLAADESRETLSPAPLLSQLALTIDETLKREPDSLSITLIRDACTRVLTLSASDDPRGASPLSTLIDILGDYHRDDPMSERIYTALDIQLLGSEVARWLLDHERGMEQIYDLVLRRIPEEEL